MRTLRSLILAPLLSTFALARAHAQDAPPVPGPDERLKADILLIVAHPDDDTVIGSYVARVISDQGKRVMILSATRGEAGGNSVGSEQSTSLGLVREMEARRALAAAGVVNIWFLEGRNVSSQDPLQSLEVWGHGAVLERAVRFIRLTRPEVIITWLPSSVIGGHGDHHAAGIIGTEAFDLAGDPAAFPEQVAPPKDRRRSKNLTEGLHPWQAKKLYFFADAKRSDLMFARQGPLYSSSDVSPSRRVPYYQLAAEEFRFHLTQGGRVAQEAIAKGDYSGYLKYWQGYSGTADAQFILGRSLVGGTVTGDVFEGITMDPVSFSPPRRPPAPPRSGVTVELAGPWGFYQDFWRAHEIGHLAKLVPSTAGVPPGNTIYVPLVLRNASSEPEDVTVSVAAPEGWTVSMEATRYRLSPHEAYPIQTTVAAPPTESKEQDIVWKAESKGRVVSSASLHVQSNRGSMPQ